MKAGWSRLSDLATSFGYWINRIPLGLFVVLSAAIVAMKSPMELNLSIRDVAEAFPTPLSTKSNLFTGIFLWRLGGGIGFYSTIGLGALLAAVVVVWLGSSISWRDSIDSRSRLLLALTWPPVLSSVAWFAYGAEFFPLGIAIAVFARRMWLMALGVVIAALSHAEIAAAAFVCLLVLSLARPFIQFRRTGLVGLLVGATVWGASTVWLRTSGVESRLDRFSINLQESLNLAISRDLLGVYAGWGIWWIVILSCLGLMQRRDALITVVAAIGVPFLAMSLTLDGNRVFAGVGAAAGLAVMQWVFGRDRQDEIRSKESAQVAQFSAWTLGVVAAGTLFLPFVQFFYSTPTAGANWELIGKVIGLLPPN